MNKHLRKNIFLFFLIFIFSTCKRDENSPVKEGDFTVLTYNIAGLPEGISQSHPLKYTAAIGQLINEYNIVHVQEDFCYHDLLLKHEIHPYKTETSGCVPTGSGLNTFSDYPISSFKRVTWISCMGPDCLTPKGFTYSRIEIAKDMWIDFYNVHINAGDTYDDFNARRHNIVQLNNYINKNSVGNAVIVMGDMNSHYTRELDTIHLMLENGFQDVWITLMRHNDIPVKGTGSLHDCDPKTSPTCEKVDKIFYRSNDQVELIPTAYQVDDDRYYYQDTISLSDHSPVYAKFHFNILK